MPRQKLTISEQIETLSVLNHYGELDRELEPEITNIDLVKLYRAMLLCRKFDERMLDLQRQGRIGTFPPIKGQEAAQLGAVAQLTEEDWLIPSFRETGAEIWRGRSLENILLYYNGYNEGGHIPENQNNMPMAIPVASQILHAVGIGWASRYREEDTVALTFFGDGATSQGDFHEGLNFAAVYQAPVIFVCQNNQWAISVPLAKQTRSQTIAQKAVAYGMPGIQVDGNDILAVYAATGEAIARARAGKGPTLIECLTYRVMMHTTADDPDKYRSKEETEEWLKKDPLIRFEGYLREKGLLNDTELHQISDQVQIEIQGAVDRAEKIMKSKQNPLNIFDHLYEALPPYLQQQRDSLDRELGQQDREDQDG